MHEKMHGVNMQVEEKVQKLSTKEAAAYLGYSPFTLRNWRMGRKEWRIGLRGPKFHSRHGRIFYFMEDLETWEKLCGTEKDF